METAWLLLKRKSKKRKADSPIKTASPEKSDPKAAKILKPPSVPISRVDNSGKPDAKAAKTLKPPPVIISKVDKYDNIMKTLTSQNINYQATCLNNNQLKINVDTPEEYKQVRNALEQNNYQWHTYENKQERPIRVMCKNVHSTCDPDEIKTYLEALNFKVIKVEPRFKRTPEGMVSLPMFILTFDKSEDIKKIYEIKYICHMKVKIEALRVSNLIPQCKKCQRYGHTRNFCNRDPVCVKCAGNHHTHECRKAKELPAKCSNCAEAHPASYRGCIVAKQLQQRRDKIKNSQKKIDASRMIEKQTSYAKAVNKDCDTNPAAAGKQENKDPDLIQMFQTMMEMIKNVNVRLDRLEGATHGAIPKRNKNNE
jgi:hypothetical protein